MFHLNQLAIELEPRAVSLLSLSDNRRNFERTVNAVDLDPALRELYGSFFVLFVILLHAGMLDIGIHIVPLCISLNLSVSSVFTAITNDFVLIATIQFLRNFR